MKDFMDFEEHKAMKEKRSKKMNSKEKSKDDFEEGDIEIILEKKPKAVKSKVKNNGTKDNVFRNNQKNFQYDYEEDFYEPDFGF